MSMRSSGGRLGRFVFLPFSIRCDSESSVALAVNQSNTPGEKGGEVNLKMNKNQNISKATLISQGLHRLVRRFKSFSQFFVYKEEEMEKEIEKEMEIGYPTDVKHVTHIGSDGSTTIINNPLSTNWKPTHHHDHHQLLSFPSLSLHQFELAMAAQSHPPLLPPST